MSGLTNGTKDYWVGFFRERIDRRISLVRERNKAAFDALKTEAQNKVAARLGLADLLAEHKACDEEAERYEKMRQDARGRRDLVSRKIFQALFGEEPGYYNQNNWQDRLRREVEAETAELLKETTWGKEISDLMNQRDTVEAQIMLATSPKELTGFIEAKLGELGIDLK